MGSIGFNTSGQFTVAGNPVNYGRNYLINSGFDRWDYATSQTISGYGSANRWISYWDGSGGTCTMSQQAFSAGELGKDTPKYFLRRNMSVASTGGVDGNALITKLEYVRKFASKTMTLSFWAKCAGTPFNLVCNVNQNFGAGGNPSASVVTPIASQLLTTGWVKYSSTFTLPSILGKTLGTTDNTSYLQLNFNQPMNTISMLDIAQIKLEEGSVATPWTPYEGEFGGEVQACGRYLPIGDYYSAGQAYSAILAGVVFTFKDKARVAPTGVLSSGTFLLTTAGGGSVSATSPVLSSPSSTSAAVNFTTSGLTAGYATILLGATGSILFTGCEL